MKCNVKKVAAIGFLPYLISYLKYFSFDIITIHTFENSNEKLNEFASLPVF